MTSQTSDFQRYYHRRLREERARRILNNLPLAHRLAADRATDPVQGERLLGEAMVGLVLAARRFDENVHGRFGSFAKPLIIEMLDRGCDEFEIEFARAEIAKAMSSQDRVQELASFLEVPVTALVGGLMDANAGEPGYRRPGPLRGVA